VTAIRRGRGDRRCFFKRICTPGIAPSSESKSRPLNGICSIRSLSIRLFSLSENSTSGDTPLTVTVSDCVPTSRLKSVFATALA